MQKNKISLLGAVLICINTIIGAGLFINPRSLTELGASWGFIGYVIGGLLITPLIVSLAELTRLHPVSGGLYIYSREHLSPLFGFLSGWSYFLSKSTSVGILTNAVVIFFRHRIPCLQAQPIFLLDCIFLGLIGLLIAAGMKMGGLLHYCSTMLKLTPILFAVFAGFFVYHGHSIEGGIPSFQHLTLLIPVALFGLTGFEIICSIGGLIDNPAQNIKRAILISFFGVISLACLFQVGLYRLLGPALADSLEPLLSLGVTALPQLPLAGPLLNAAVYTSIIGSIVAMFGSNCWNLYTLAQHNHIPGVSFLTRLNTSYVPWGSLLMHGIVSCLILAITNTQMPLQNMSIFAMFLAYFLTACAFFSAIIKGHSSYHAIIPLSAMGTCVAVLIMCLRNMAVFGVSLPFLFLFVAGCAFAGVKKLLS